MNILKKVTEIRFGTNSYWWQQRHVDRVRSANIMKNIWINKWIQYRWWFTSGKKKLELHDIMIVVRSLFNDHNKYILKFS